ncbi:MAG: hypothetical protein AB1346_10780 [Thermodesulfobacteriota bacterium]
MTGRRGKTGKRKDSLRYAVISPAESAPLDFSDRLAGSPNLSFARRAGAALLSAASLCIGAILAAFGMGERSWLSGLIGLSSILYGIGWARTAMSGKSPEGRLRLNPWRRR